MKLWLDDMRPAPEGWLWVKTVEQAKDILRTAHVTEASLDHDLGACETCLRGRTPEQWLEETNYTQMPNCEHFGTGYDLVLWLEEFGDLPDHCVVHSRNPAGRARMEAGLKAAYARHKP